MPVFHRSINTEHTFTWALMLENGQPPVHLFDSIEEESDLWIRHQGRIRAREGTLYMVDLAVSRVDVAIEISIDHQTKRRYSGPWLIGGAETARHKTIRALVTSPCHAAEAVLVPLHGKVAGEVLVHLRCVFSRPARLGGIS